MSFESAPKIKPKEEAEPEFKVSDKRAVKGREDMARIEAEIRAERGKARFDAMTREEREEWEYRRDQARGFTVKDQRRFRVAEMPPETQKSEAKTEAPVEIPPPVEVQSPVEPSPVPVPEKPSLRQQAEQMRQDRYSLRSSVEELKKQVTETEKAIGKYGKFNTLGRATEENKLRTLYGQLEDSLTRWRGVETVIYDREAIDRELKQAKKS